MDGGREEGAGGGTGGTLVLCLSFYGGTDATAALPPSGAMPIYLAAFHVMGDCHIGVSMELFWFYSLSIVVASQL